MSKRADLYPIIARMRHEERLPFKEIGKRLGISNTTANDYYHDPTGAKVLARKRKANCARCGIPVRTDGKAPSLHCSSCDHHLERQESRERVVRAIQEWNKKYGHPPSATDWNPAQAESLGMFDRAKRYREEGCWPPVASVQRVFGSWNEAIRQAGFEALPSGHRRKEEK